MNCQANIGPCGIPFAWLLMSHQYTEQQTSQTRNRHIPLLTVGPTSDTNQGPPKGAHCITLLMGFQPWRAMMKTQLNALVPARQLWNGIKLMKSSYDGPMEPWIDLVIVGAMGVWLLFLWSVRDHNGLISKSSCFTQLSRDYHYNIDPISIWYQIYRWEILLEAFKSILW